MALPDRQTEPLAARWIAEVAPRPAEFMTDDGCGWSWYCSRCLLELGVDLSDRNGEPRGGCPEHGKEYLTRGDWEDER